MNPDARTRKIVHYGAAHTILMDALARYPESMWTFKPSLDVWCIHEIVLHITDSEANSFIRCRRLIAEPGKALMAYDENQWARALDYTRLSTTDAVELFRWLRGNTYHLIRSLPEAVWAHQANHPESGEITLEDWLDTYSHHVPEHVEQMERVYAAWKKQAR